METALLSGFRIVMLLLCVLTGAVGLVYPWAWLLTIVFLLLGISVNKLA